MPSAFATYAGIPLSGLLGLVLLAALHQGLGAPLGPGWGAELWMLVKSGVVIVPAYLAGAVYVRRHNARVEAMYAADAEARRAFHHDSYPTVERLTDGRRQTTGSHPALHRGTGKHPALDDEEE